MTRTALRRLAVASAAYVLGGGRGAVAYRLNRILGRNPSRHASALAKHGAQQRRRAWEAKRNAVTQQIRDEIGLPPSQVLQ